MQRTLTIAAIVIVLIGGGVAAYFFFSTGTTVIDVAPAGNTVNLPVAGGITHATSTEAGVSGTPVVNSGGSSPKIISSRLVRISAGPVVPGETVVDKKAINASSSPEASVNFIERGSGNVFSYLINAKTLTRISNKTVPGIQSASWLPDGSAAFVRYLSGDNFSTINTYALTATSSGGFFLPQNLADINVSPMGVLTLASGVNGSVVSLGRIDGTHFTTLFTTPLVSLRVSFAGKNQYLVYTKPSADLSGAAFLVDSTGRFSRIAVHNGLVALASPLGKWVLVSYARNNTMQMELVNTATNETLPLPIATIADKCVWTADDSAIYCGIPMNPSLNFNYPDDWYQGAVQFSDRIWKIEVPGRYAKLVLDFSKETKGSIDIESPATDSADTALVFINKNDGSLWSYSF